MDSYEARKAFFKCDSCLLPEHLGHSQPAVCASDQMSWTQSVLPLLGPLLYSMPSKVFMAQSLLAAVVLQPALMHSWLALHLVNANFAFAACTLLAAWQVSQASCVSPRCQVCHLSTQTSALQ